MAALSLVISLLYLLIHTLKTTYWKHVGCRGSVAQTQCLVVKIISKTYYTVFISPYFVHHGTQGKQTWGSQLGTHLNVILYTNTIPPFPPPNFFYFILAKQLPSHTIRTNLGSRKIQTMQLILHV